MLVLPRNYYKSSAVPAERAYAQKYVSSSTFSCGMPLWYVGYFHLLVREFKGRLKIVTTGI